MKIIAIRLKNLTSIEGSVEIDFTVEPLSSAGIFAISGATGAGKSTLFHTGLYSYYCIFGRSQKSWITDGV